MHVDDLLSPEWQAFVAGARFATLTTLGPDGTPNSVPICLVVEGGVLWSPIDEKPKRSRDPRGLRRVRDLARDPRAAILVHHWDEDWSKLAFAELRVVGRLVEPGGDGHADAVAALRLKYAQYRDHALEGRPVLRLEPVSVAARWTARDTGADPRSS